VTWKAWVKAKYESGRKLLNHHRFGTLPASMNYFMSSLIGSFMREVSQTGDDLIFDNRMHTILNPSARRVTGQRRFDSPSTFFCILVPHL